nr:RNase L inhibitor [Cryptomonas sp.]
MTEQTKRIAVISTDKCKPKRCHCECKKSCPVVRIGKLCIQVSSSDEKACISETQCIGCGICIKKCPFQAIQIVNISNSIQNQIVHRYGANSFQLVRLPSPKPGQILGIIGSNGIGKSTAIKILAGKIKPNLGNFIEPPDWKKIKNFFRGCDLQNYFDLLIKENFNIHIKPQYVDIIAETNYSSVIEILSSIDKKGEKKKEIIEKLHLYNISERKVKELSGGELQRFAVACVLIQNGRIFLFDEISSYLDIKQRLQVAQAIRSLIIENSNAYVIVIEHDLAIVDYLSDFICCFYGIPGIYGIVSIPFPVKEGINIFLSGYIPNENLRFRENSICFLTSKNEVDLRNNFSKSSQVTYPSMFKTFDSFKLSIDSGTYSSSEIIVLMGENGTGKTSFVRLLGGIIKPDTNSNTTQSRKISYKPQKISPNFSGPVSKLVLEKLGNLFFDPYFKDNIINPLDINSLLDKYVGNLSGGEIQRLSIALCLGKVSDLYLIDEPSAYLDSEQRLVVSRIIKRFISNTKKSSFIVEHDFIMATYLADQVIVFDGIPSIRCTASAPLSINKGINKFLKQLDITFRKDPVSLRPRINKLNSVKDKEQKKLGEYFFFE